MKRVGVVLHRTRSDAVAIARWLGERLTDRGIHVEAPVEDAERVGAAVAASERFPDGLDLVFVLGGDGTLLRAAQLAYESQTPLLGINLGRLGFLSELERGELEAGLRRIVEDGFAVEERTVLQGEIVQRSGSAAVWALNDIIVAKVDPGRAIKLSVSLGGQPFVGWATDGLIIATATGSTAYSFSAGGPVVSPEVECFILTPVAPHGLFDRSIIVPTAETVVVHVAPDPDAASVSADGGPGIPLSSEAEVRIRAGAKRVRLAKLDPVPFWRLVREKFGLRPEPH